jgi:hypothetical protein
MVHQGTIRGEGYRGHASLQIVEGVFLPTHPNLGLILLVQGIMEPFLYRDLRFTDLSRLQRTVLCLPALGEKIGRWTRTLHISFHEKAQADQAVDTAVAVALHAHQLLRLTVECHAPPIGLLAVVVAVAPTSLRHLSLSCAWQDGLSTLMLSRIGSFCHLRTLKLFLYQSDQATLPWLLSLDALNPWTLHELRTLDINVEALHDQREIQARLVQFLSRCVLGEPNKLCVRLEGFATEHSPVVEEFFGRHVRLYHCSLLECDTAIYDVALAHADTPSLLLGGLPSVATRNPRVHALCIEAPFDVETADIISFMAALGDQQIQDTEAMQLHLRCYAHIMSNFESEATFPLQWMAADTNSDVTPSMVELAFLGQMLRIAIRLRARGILLLDYSDKSIDGVHYEFPDDVFLRFVTCRSQGQNAIES